MVKKLMMLFAAVALAGAAQAATFRWYTGGDPCIYDSSCNQYYSGSAVIMAYLDGASSASAVKAATVTVSGGVLNATADWAGATAGEMYWFYLVITDGGKVFDSSVSDHQTLGSAYVSASGTNDVWLDCDVLHSNTSWSAYWTDAPAAPEPTSGLLLLVGGALLALRRKRLR